jgi:hypothetical protein
MASAAVKFLFRPALFFSGPEEREPDRAEDQDRKAGGDDKQSKHRRSWFGLPRFGWRFDDLTVLSRCHGALDSFISRQKPSAHSALGTESNA